MATKKSESAANSVVANSAAAKRRVSRSELIAAERIENESDWATTFKSLAEAVPEILFPALLRAIAGIQDLSQRSNALAEVIPHVPQEWLPEAVKMSDEISRAIATQRENDPSYGKVSRDRGTLFAVPLPGPGDFARADIDSISHGSVLFALMTRYGSLDSENRNHQISPEPLPNIDKNISVEQAQFDDIFASVSRKLSRFVNSFLFRRKDEGDVLHRVDQKLQLWNATLEAENVPDVEREALIAKFRIEIARVTRPKWHDRRLRGGQLAIATAPQFLKEVHAEEIGSDGSVHTEIIRAIDPDLMKAVELYLSKRRARQQDLGDARGLRFVYMRPSRAVTTKTKAKARLQP